MKITTLALDRMLRHETFGEAHAATALVRGHPEGLGKERRPVNAGLRSQG